jgi:hypothetical protein
MKRFNKLSKEIDFSSVWIGPELNPLSVICLESFGRAGLPINLYVYEKPINTPKNVNLLDASTIVRPERIFRHIPSGSYAVFADIFRYHLLAKTDTVYVDTDIYCIRKPEIREYMFGWEDNVHINNAVLRMPPDCRLLKSLINFVDNNFLPPPFSFKPGAIRAMVMHLISGRPTAQYLGWGKTGPDILTYYVKNYNLQQLAVPKEYYYPLHYYDIESLLDAKKNINEIIFRETEFIHLYNEMLRKLEYKSAPKNSPINMLMSGDFAI